MSRLILFYSVLFLFFISCNGDSLKKEKRYRKSVENLINYCWNEKDLALIDAIFEDNFTRIVNNINMASNIMELEANMNVYFTGFPDLHFEINDLYIKNNQAFLVWTFTGTNTGAFGEVKATGKKVAVKGFTKILFNNKDKIIHEEAYYNELDLLQQLGYTLLQPNVE